MLMHQTRTCGGEREGEETVAGDVTWKLQSTINQIYYNLWIIYSIIMFKLLHSN